jgi:anthranilate phosphoribosyltransferase
MRVGPVLAGVVAQQGREALVFHGDDGLDELAATGPATVWEVREGVVTEHRLDAVTELGLPAISIEDLRGGDADQNAAVARQVFAGESGPVRDTVILNAAAGIVADATLPGTAQGSLAYRFQAGMDHAARAIDSGNAAAVLQRWVAASAH